MFRTISTFSYGLSRMAIYHGGIKKAKKLLDEGKVKEAEDFLMNKYVIKSLIVKIPKALRRDIAASPTLGKLHISLFNFRFSLDVFFIVNHILHLLFQVQYELM